MPRYLVQRQFPDDLQITVAESGAQAFRGVSQIYVSLRVCLTSLLQRADARGDPTCSQPQHAADQPDHRGARARTPISSTDKGERS